MSVNDVRAETAARMRAGALSGGEIIECLSHPDPFPDRENVGGGHLRKSVDNDRASACRGMVTRGAFF